MTEWKVVCPHCEVEFFVSKLPARCEACGYLISEEDLGVESAPHEEKPREELRAAFPVLTALRERLLRRRERR